MLRFLIFILLVGFKITGNAQVNLVPNSSFELFTDCPYGYSLIDYDEVVFPSVNDWIKPTQGSSDYYNTCADAISGVEPPGAGPGFQFPHSGDAFTGMYTHFITYDYREYVQAKLISPLVAGEIYWAGFYVNAAVVDGFWGCGGISDDIGMYISTTRISDFASSFHIDVIPQIENTEGLFFSDTSSWYLVSGYYEASGGEEWITIGNFKDLANTDYIEFSGSATKCVYLFVDDAFVIEPTVLPVTLLNFTGVLIDSKIFPSVELKWSTEEEIKNCCFTVERSTDGNQFNDLAIIAAGNMNGETYKYYDDEPEAGINYYRLKQEDIDGTSKYSAIIAVNNIKNTPAVFSSDGTIKITNEGDLSFEGSLYNSTGKLIGNISIYPGTISWTPLVAPGVYILKVTTSNGNLITKSYSILL